MNPENNSYSNSELNLSAGSLREIQAKLEESQQTEKQLRQEVVALRTITGDLKSSFHEFALLDEMIFAEGRQLNPDNVLLELVGLLGQCLPLSSARILLINKDTYAFEPVYDWQLTREQEQEVGVRMEEGTFAWVIREGGPMVMPFVVSDKVSQTMIVAPILLGRKPLGVACLFSQLSDAAYTPQIFQMIKSLVRRASVSISNARRVFALEKKAEEVARMKDYLDLIMDNLLQGVVVVDGNDTVTLFNHTAELLFGLEETATVGVNYKQCFSGDLLLLLADIIPETRQDEGVVDYEFELDRGEGVIFRLGLTSAVLADYTDKAGSVVLTFRDLRTAKELLRLQRSDRFKSQTITRFKENLTQVQRQLQRSEKLASIGQMAAGVAHEINNPLGSIAGFIQIILMDCPEDDPNRKFLTAMAGEVKRMKNIVIEMLDFARQQPSKGDARFPVNINNIVSETLKLVAPQANEAGVEITLDLEEQSSFVLGQADRLKQVFINICLNSFAAMDKTGNTLAVATRTTSDSEGLEWVEITFLDNGEGIRQQDLPRIFDPFFTTREQGKGTGLGLATCFGIVEQHGGVIQAESVWAEGSTFTVRLPVSKES